MVDRIIKVLKNIGNISEWKLVERDVKSKELFFIKNELDMNRAKHVIHYDLTVYRDFEENGEQYKGSSQTQIHPTMTDEEIMSSIENAVYASQFVKNKYYPLVAPTNEIIDNINYDLSLESSMSTIIDAIFKADCYEKGWINSTEIFLNEVKYKILNSQGVNLSYKKIYGSIEFVTTWKEEVEEVELYKLINFANLDSNDITQKVDMMLRTCRGRALAQKMPSFDKHTVLLTDNAVKEIFSYYVNKGNVAYVYQGYSTAKVGNSIQGELINGDKVNITLKPLLKGSTQSEPVDEDGVILKDIKLITDGILNNYWGNSRYSHYLNVKPTGNIRNYEVCSGSKSTDDMKSEPYLELVSFSDFQIDIFTGDFGGEVRLGWYYDGKNTIPVTSGSISGNIKDFEKEMYFSKEVTQDNNFIGPKYIQLFDVAVNGN